MGIFCYFTIENEQLCEAQNRLMAGYPCTPKTFCRDDVHLFLWTPSTDWITPLSGNMHLPFGNISDGAFPYDMGKSPHEPRSKLPTGNCHSLYRHMPFALPAIAVRPTGNCHSPYRQLPFANQSRDFGQLSPFPRLSVPHKRLILGLNCKKKYGDPRKDGLIYSQTEVVWENFKSSCPMDKEWVSSFFFCLTITHPRASEAAS